MRVLGLQMIRIPLCIFLSPHLPHSLHQKYPSLDWRCLTTVHTKIIGFFIWIKKMYQADWQMNLSNLALFFSKVQLPFNLKEQRGVVVLLLDSAQDSCPAPEQNQYWGVLLLFCYYLSFSCVSGKRKDTQGMSGSRISPAQLFGVDAFSVCWKWCPELLPETLWLTEALVKSFIPKCLFYIHVQQMETAALWSTQIFVVWDKNSHPFVREWHHCAHLFPGYIESMFEAGGNVFVPLLFPRCIRW